MSTGNSKAKGWRAKAPKAPAVDSETLAEKRKEVIEEHGKSKKTRESYKGQIERGRAFLESYANGFLAPEDLGQEVV